MPPANYLPPIKRTTKFVARESDTRAHTRRESRHHCPRGHRVIPRLISRPAHSLCRLQIRGDRSLCCAPLFSRQTTAQIKRSNRSKKREAKRWQQKTAHREHEQCLFAVFGFFVTVCGWQLSLWYLFYTGDVASIPQAPLAGCSEIIMAENRCVRSRTGSGTVLTLD